MTSDEKKRVISNYIMKTAEYPEAVFYKASCECGGHIQDIIMERDEAIGDITLTLYDEFSLKDYWRWPRWQVPFKRLALAFKIIFKGYLEMECSFLFQREDAIKDYIAALEQGLEHIKSGNLKGKKERNEE